MEKEIAKSIISNALRFGDPIDNMLAEVEKIEDKFLKEKYKNVIIQIIALVDVDIILSIENIYPDLNPDL